MWLFLNLIYISRNSSSIYIPDLVSEYILVKSIYSCNLEFYKNVCFPNFYKTCNYIRYIQKVNNLSIQSNICERGFKWDMFVKQHEPQSNLFQFPNRMTDYWFSSNQCLSKQWQNCYLRIHLAIKKFYSHCVQNGRPIFSQMSLFRKKNLTNFHKKI